MTKRPMHFVLRSTLARGKWSFLHPLHAAFIRTIVPVLAKKFGVILYEWSQNSNHLHFLLKAREREGLQKFLMVVCARIAMKVTGARKGKPLGRRFFDTIPFSRIVEWGRAFQAAAQYVKKNGLEAAGLIPYERKGKRAVAAVTFPRHHVIGRQA